MVVTVSALDGYFEAFRALCQELLVAWHLALAAEDRCRAEHFPWLTRTVTHAEEQGRLPLNLDFLPLQPWIGVFTAAARVSEHWQKEVRRPAIEFIARGIRGSIGSSAGILMDAARALLEETHHRVQAVVNE